MLSGFWLFTLVVVLAVSPYAVPVLGIWPALALLGIWLFTTPGPKSNRLRRAGKPSRSRGTSDSR